MLKVIEKSSVNNRSFKVHKEWTVTDSDYPIVSASAESGLFETGSATQQDGLYIHTLYKSLRAKYYNQNANVTTLFGQVDNIADISKERKISTSYRTIALPQEKFGEGIKKGSISLSDLDGNITYRDDEKGNLAASVPLYIINKLDFETEEIEIEDNDAEIFTGTVSSFDAETGIMIATFGTDTDSFTVVEIDLPGKRFQTSVPLDFDDLDIDEIRYGNVFYSDGLVVLSTAPTFNNYRLQYRSTKTIHETEVLINIKAGEFNYSQSPSAVEVTVSGSYDFETTAIPNVKPAGTVKIKEYTDIKRKTSYEGSYGSTTGSWTDYDTYRNTDPTGSYLTTFISTIGLYDDDLNLVAVAKLPKPIKNLPDYDLNFIVRFDT